MNDKAKELRENFLKTVEAKIKESEKETWMTPKHLISVHPFDEKEKDKKSDKDHS